MGKRHKIGGDGLYLPEEAQEGHFARFLRQTHNAGPDVRRIDARNRFLEAAAELDSALLRSLRTDVLPLYDHRWTLDEKLSELRYLHHSYEAVSRLRKFLSPFGLALVEWLERWHLTETWAMNAAVWTVQSWKPRNQRGGRCPPDPPLKWRLENPQRFYPPVVGTFQPHAATWQLNETADTFMKRALASCEEEIRRWVAEQGAGYRPTPDKLNLEHFRWCALYQVYGFSFGSILKAIRPAEKSLKGDHKVVESGVKATFDDLIGMTPRKLSRGKRKGYSGADYGECQVAEIRKMMSLKN